jgi:uncharacterized protein YpmB
VIFIAVLGGIALVFWRYQEQIEEAMLRTAAWLADFTDSPSH